MNEKQYTQLAFIIMSLFAVGITLIMFKIELGAYLSALMLLCFTILSLHFLFIGFWNAVS